jgi:hypothetical protein
MGAVTGKLLPWMVEGLGRMLLHGFLVFVDALATGVVR